MPFRSVEAVESASTAAGKDEEKAFSNMRLLIRNELEEFHGRLLRDLHAFAVSPEFQGEVAISRSCVGKTPQKMRLPTVDAIDISDSEFNGRLMSQASRAPTHPGDAGQEPNDGDDHINGVHNGQSASSSEPRPASVLRVSSEPRPASVLRVSSEPRPASVLRVSSGPRPASVLRVSYPSRVDTPHPDDNQELHDDGVSNGGDADADDDGDQDLCGSPFLKALSVGDMAGVLSCLETKSDPNKVFNSFTFRKKEFTRLTPLAMAMLQDNIPLARHLVKANADLESKYGFRAGAEQIEWSGSAAHATIPAGHLDSLKSILDLGADPSSPGSNGATLLWNAAYFGQEAIVMHLISVTNDVETPALSQDDSTLSLTPLHAASAAGHCAVLALLIKAKAKLHVDNGEGTTPLDDAVDRGWDDVVELLTASGGELYRKRARSLAVAMNDNSLSSAVRRSVLGSTSSATGTRFSDFGDRCIDRIFNMENPVVIAAAAKGIKRAPELLNQLTTSDLLRFLQSVGDAPVLIMQAIFQPQKIMFWRMDRQGFIRREMRPTAFVNRDQGMNTIEGPSPEYLTRLFNAKQILPVDMMHHVNSIAPTQSRPRSMFVPVSFLVAHLPSLHKDLGVLVAIADCDHEGIYAEPGCKAILDLAWHSEGIWSKGLVAVSAILLFNYCQIAYVLHDPSRNLRQLRLAVGVAAVCWTLSVAMEVAQIIGYCQSGQTRRGLSTTESWMTKLILGVSGIVLASTAAMGSRVIDYPVYRIALGCVLCQKWLGLLSTLRQYKIIALRILPILDAMMEVGPFTFVLAVFVLATTSCYYALGIQDFPNSLVTNYRMATLLDFYLAELQGGSHPEAEYYWAVRVLLILVTFTIGIVNMNLFVAVLCSIYSQAEKRAQLTFLRNRANMLLDLNAMRTGREVLVKMFIPLCKTRRTNSRGLHGDSESENSYIWICHQRV